MTPTEQILFLFAYVIVLVVGFLLGRLFAIKSKDHE